jgi:hypothetical protein
MNRALVIAVTCITVGCASPGGLTGHTEAELKARMGPPSAEYPNPDGSRTLAYSMGRFWTETYMAEVAPNGDVRSVRSARNDDTFHRIVPGMRRDEVLRLIGPPGEAMHFPRLGHDSWEYQFIDTWGYKAFFYVNLDARGIVVSKLTRRLESRDSSGFSR